MKEGGGGASEPLPPLLLAPFLARSFTLVPRSLLLNRTQTLATQARRAYKRKGGGGGGWGTYNRNKYKSALRQAVARSTDENAFCINFTY